MPWILGQTTNTNVLQLPEPTTKPSIPGDVLSLAKLMIVPVAATIIQGLKVWIPKIPGGVWPILAPVVGMLIDFLASKVGLWTGNVMVGLMFGGLATWFYQLDKSTVGVMAGTNPPEAQSAQEAQKTPPPPPAAAQ